MRAAVWSAPGRVNLIGEHTDYNGGLALSVAIDLRTRATVRRRSDSTVTVRSQQRPGETVRIELADIGPGAPGSWASYAAGILAVLARHGHPVTGADITLDSDVPEGAGLSSSASIACAVASAAADAFALDLTPEAVAAVAQEAENTVVGVPCGALDQRTAMLAREGHALLLDFAAGTADHVPVPAGRALVVVDTRVRHALADGQYAERRAACERAAHALGVATLSEVAAAALPAALERVPADLVGVTRHVVSENDRVRATVDGLRASDWRRVGALLSASHRSLRDDYRVSCPELDLAVETLVAAGADGARMTGGGFGGSAIAALAPDDLGPVRAAVEAAFADASLARPEVRVVRPSAGARAEG